MIPLAMQGSLYILLGPGAESGHMFADLMDQLLIAESGSTGFEFQCPSDRAGDFEGVDSIALVQSDTSLDGMSGKIGFQYKFVPSESNDLSSAHKTQIENSFRAAVNADKDKKLSYWVLVTPEDFNKFQYQWLLSLERNTHCKVRHWGQKKIVSLIQRYPHCAVAFFPELGHGLQPGALRELCEKMTEVLDNAVSGSELYIQTELQNGSTIEGALVQFLESDQNLFCLLGSYGSGKTVVLEHFTLQICRAYLRGHSSRAPLLIKLRGVRGTSTFAHNTVEYIRKEYGVDLDVTTLKTLNASGKILLIMDGLDEKEPYGDRRFGRTKLGEIFNFLSVGGKLIVSSRTEYFKDAIEEWDFVLGAHRPQILSQDRTLITSNDRRGVIGYVAPLSMSLIRLYVEKSVGLAEASSLLASMKTLYDIRDVITRPVLLDMICKVLPRLIGAGRRVLVTDLYSSYVRQQLEDDLIAHRMSLPIDKRLGAIQCLAENMVLLGVLKIFHSDLPKYVSLLEEESDRDFLNTAFLIRDAQGYYEFSHRSFLEYFAAASLFASLQAPFPISKQWQHVNRITMEEFGFLHQFIAASWEERLRLTRQVGPPTISTPEKHPVRIEEYEQFMKEKSYTPIAPIGESYGFVLTSYFDALAYSLHRGASIPATHEMENFVHREWPHATLHFSLVPLDSVFSCNGPDKAGPVHSHGGAIVVRNEREWTRIADHFTTSWFNCAGIRELRVFGVSSSDATTSRALFRCMGLFPGQIA